MYNYKSGEGVEEDIIQESSRSVQRCGQPTGVTVPEEQSYDRLRGKQIKTAPHAGGAHF